MDLDRDIQGMELALKQAYLGLGLTSPNPPVGAIIISQAQAGESARILGKGYHPKAGEAHAERRAIADAIARGNQELLGQASIYVTLEPCSSWGRTPPCTDAIIQAGIKRVVYGCADPDMRHQGRAEAILLAEGVEVISGCLRHLCERLLRPWSYAITHHRPWVIAKVASSLDGHLSRKTTPWLSSNDSLRYAHELRAQSDAILIGGETLRRDNPSLSIRQPINPINPNKQQPWRIALSREPEKLREQCAKSHFFSDQHAHRSILYGNIQNFEKEVLEPLFNEYGVVQLMLECGGELLKQFLDQGLVNEWVQVICPHLSGGPHALLPGETYLSKEAQLGEKRWIKSGDDMILRAIIEEKKQASN